MERKAELALASLHFISTIAANELQKKRKHRFWVRKIFLEREKYGFQNCLIKELRTRDQEYYFDFMRMTPQLFDEILFVVLPAIEKQNTFWRKSISPSERLALTLRFLATGETYRSLSFAFRVGRETVRRIIPEVCNALWTCFKTDCLPFPATPEEWKKISAGFTEKWQFPHCCGSIDGKHVLRECPSNSGSLYHNYKGTFSTVLMAVVDANYRFLMVDYGHYGSESDGGIFGKTIFGHSLVSGKLNFPPPDPLPFSTINFPYFITGDEAFPLKRHLMRPYPRHIYRGHDERIFNYRLCRARRVVENAFGVMAARFRIFKRPLKYNDADVKSMVLASCVLHNMLVEKSDAYCPHDFVDHEDNNHQMKMGLWRQEQQELKRLKKLSSNMYSKEIKQLRDTYKHYLLCDGSVSWQEHAISVV